MKYRTSCRGLTANGTSNQFHVLDFHTLKWAKDSNQPGRRRSTTTTCVDSTQHGRNGHKYIRAWKRDILDKHDDDSTFQFNTDTALWEKISNGQIYKETGIGGSSISFDRQNKEAILLGGYKEGTLDELGKLKINAKVPSDGRKFQSQRATSLWGQLHSRPQE